MLAHSTGRTLVLPPKKVLNHEKGSHSFDDFFDLDAINTFQEGVAIITMDEFLAKEVRAGHVCRHNGTTNDCGKVHHKDHWYRDNPTDLYTLLESVGHVPQWNSDPPTCALAVPGSKRGGTKGHPANDVPLCTYNSTAKLLHLSNRILSPHYSFVVFEDEQQDLFAKRLVRNFLHYNDDIVCEFVQLPGLSKPLDRSLLLMVCPRTSIPCTSVEETSAFSILKDPCQLPTSWSKAVL